MANHHEPVVERGTAPLVFMLRTNLRHSAVGQVYSDEQRIPNQLSSVANLAGEDKLHRDWRSES